MTIDRDFFCLIRLAQRIASVAKLSWLALDEEASSPDKFKEGCKSDRDAVIIPK